MMKVRQVRIEGDAAYVPLTRGYEAIIDSEDAHLIEGHNWNAYHSGRTIYAKTQVFILGMWRTINLHRTILSPSFGFQVDHIDGDGLNNRRSNLRIATKSENMHNQRTRIDNKSGLKGVHWHKRDQKWVAKIMLDNKRKHLGYFENAQDAHAAYCEASKRLHGEFGRVA